MGKDNDYSREAMLAAGEALFNIDRAMNGYRSLAVEIVGLSIRAPRMRNGEFFVTVRGLDEDGAPVVAFHSAFTLGDAVRGVESRLANGSLRWKVDEFRT